MQQITVIPLLMLCWDWFLGPEAVCLVPVPVYTCPPVGIANSIPSPFSGVLAWMINSKGLSKRLLKLWDITIVCHKLSGSQRYLTALELHKDMGQAFIVDPQYMEQMHAVLRRKHYAALPIALSFQQHFSFTDLLNNSANIH